jgi:hypothetical protein
MGNCGFGIVPAPPPLRDMIMRNMIWPEKVSTTPRPGPPIAPTRASNSETSLIVVALYNKQYPRRALGVFDSCAAAQARGNELYIQITCQPLSFDFRLASAYPFYSHPAFDAIKAHDREQLIDGVR